MVLISAGKLFKDSKIAWTRRASAIGSLKNFQVLIYTKLRKKSCFHLLIIYMKKKTKQNKTKQSTRPYFKFLLGLQLCTRVTWKMPRFQPIRSVSFFHFYHLPCLFLRFWNDFLKLWQFFFWAPCEASRLMRKAAAWSELFPRNCITFSLW